MGISLSNQFRLAIMRERESLCESNDYTSTSDLDLYEVEDAIAEVLASFEWVAADEVREAAESLAEDFDGIEIFPTV